MPRTRHGNVLKPGTEAPCSGVYQSSHCRHRAPHYVTVLKGEILPACRHCGEQVRYRLHQVEQQPAAFRRAPSLLLVDPENTISYTLKQILEGSGYRVSTAGTYPAASSILRQRAFDVVLTELDLERGAEGLRLALDAKQQQPAPVVILSVSKPSQEGLRSALGVANYLVFKPIDLGELQNALHTMVARRALQLAPE